MAGCNGDTVSPLHRSRTLLTNALGSWYKYKTNPKLHVFTVTHMNISCVGLTHYLYE